MKVILFFVCAFGVQAAPLYVWDIIKAPLRTDQVFDIISNAVPGQSFPIYASIPQSNFDCSKQKFPGYYADVSTQCQVFYRCDLSGVRTDYLCPNTTIFDQIRLVCDYFFNVDCANGANYTEFANSRLYTDQVLFDSPPAGYVVPWLRESRRIEGPDTGTNQLPTEISKPSSTGENGNPKIVIVPPTTAAPEATPAPEATTPAAAAETTTASAETTAAPSETTAASAETTTVSNATVEPATTAAETTVVSAENTTAPSEVTTVPAETTTTSAGVTTPAPVETSAGAAAAETTTAATGATTPAPEASTTPTTTAAAETTVASVASTAAPSGTTTGTGEVTTPPTSPTVPAETTVAPAGTTVTAAEVSS